MENLGYEGKKNSRGSTRNSPTRLSSVGGMTFTTFDPKILEYEPVSFKQEWFLSQSREAIVMEKVDPEGGTQYDNEKCME